MKIGGLLCKYSLTELYIPPERKTLNDIHICLAEERHKEPENDTDMGCQPVTPGWVECLTLQTT